jgi:Tol biopolymer transport system component
MTADRLERRLPDVLHELSLPRVPDYVDNLLSRTERMPQRPGWTFPERWFPVSTFTDALPAGQRLTLRPLVAIAVLVILAIVSVVLIAGSQPHPAPPFGLARNGVMLLPEDGGNIVAVDPVTGSRRTLATGTNLCCASVSPDGLRFAYSHVPAPGADPVGLTVARFDGSVIRVIPDDVANSSWYEWSPAGDKLLLTRATGADIIDLASGELKSVSPNADPFEVTRASWIGTTGDILFSQRIAETAQTGSTIKFLRLPAGATTGARELGRAQYVISDAGVSPDGSKFLYFVWGPEVRLQGKLHVFDVATGLDRAVTPEVNVASAEITEWENPVWSPDGSHIAAELYTAGPNHIAVIPATGGDPVLVGPEFPTGSGGAMIRFSPDGESLLVTYRFNEQTWLLPVAGGTGQQLPWATNGDQIDWQRLAP